MKRLIVVLALCFAMSSCVTPVLRPATMKAGRRDADMTVLSQQPTPYIGKLFILGGVILKTTVTNEGSVVEAMYVPVDANGYLKDVLENGRFLAIYPKKDGILDPMIYKRKREVTIAGYFEGTRKGTLDKAEYNFPVFRISEIYLWNQEYSYAYPYYYSPYYYPYYGSYYSPWWGGGYYWGSPWWGWGGYGGYGYGGYGYRNWR